jgi:hypothetical protein
MCLWQTAPRNRAAALPRVPAFGETFIIKGSKKSTAMVVRSSLTGLLATL